MTNVHADYQRALLVPSSVHSVPRDVLQDEALSKAHELELLRRWQVGAREEQVAEEEGMGGGEGSGLIEVEEAIKALRAGGC